MVYLSVLMSARNAEKTISKAVKSSLAAMPRDSELLVLLDNSQDASLSLLEKISDSRMRLIVSNERLGINKGRNLLLREAAGEYVAIMDADDICLPWRFHVSNSLISRFDAVFGTAIVFGSRLRPFPILPQLPLSLSGETMKLALSLSNPLVHSTAMIRRSSIIDAGGYSDAKSEDYELWIRMQNLGYKLFRSWVPLICYRFHSAQASQEEDFMIQVQSDPKLIHSITQLRDEVSFSVAGRGGWNSSVEASVRRRAYTISPLLRLEHKGLPDFLKRWKKRASKPIASKLP